jgi:hypothetical protein
MLSRRGLITAATAAAFPVVPGHAASAQVLRIGMTAADLPTTHGIPNNGGEGFRFLGYPAYDSVVNWDFTHTDPISRPACSPPGMPMKPTRCAGFARFVRVSRSTMARPWTPTP